jgi:hypothetical protein
MQLMLAGIGRGRVLLAASASAVIVLMATAGSAAASQADYNKAYALGLSAYTYGLPLLETNKTFLTMTSINVSNNQGFGPVNQFNSARSLNNPKSKAVVAPGANALSSIAWLDLRREPQVLHVPSVTDHFFVLALIDPYTNDLMNIGSVHNTEPGDYVIAGPGQHNVPIPAGAHRIDVNYTRIWIIGSTQLKGKSDLANVNRIQDGYTLTPLSKYDADYSPQPPADPNTKVRNYQLPSGLQFFDVLGQLLKQFPPPTADRAELRELAAVGIGPGMNPSQNPRLNSDTLRGLKAAVGAGPKQINADAKALFLAGFATHDGYLLGGFGQYGTNYKLRAVIAQNGLGAFTSDQSIFALSLTDHSLAPLSGSSNYVLHMPAAPPVNEGWTLTVYTLNGFLVPNPINRYQFSNASQLAHNANGSFDLYLQSTRPTSATHVQNWLPTPRGAGFELIWRLLAPKPGKITGILNGTGWEPPAITLTQ